MREGIYCLNWVSFLLPSTRYFFHYLWKASESSKITCLAKSEAFLIRKPGHWQYVLTFMFKKGRYKNARCFGREREDKPEDCWQRKLMCRIVNFLISILTTWCTLGQLQSWHSLKRCMPRGQMLLLQKHSQSWHLWAVKLILRGVEGEDWCSGVSRGNISVAWKFS